MIIYETRVTNPVIEIKYFTFCHQLVTEFYISTETDTTVGTACREGSLAVACTAMQQTTMAPKQAACFVLEQHAWLYETVAL